MRKDLKENVKYTIQIPLHSCSGIGVQHTEHLRTTEATSTLSSGRYLNPPKSGTGFLPHFFICPARRCRDRFYGPDKNMDLSQPTCDPEFFMTITIASAVHINQSAPSVLNGSDKREQTVRYAISEHRREDHFFLWSCIIV